MQELRQRGTPLAAIFSTPLLDGHANSTRIFHGLVRFRSGHAWLDDESTRERHGDANRRHGGQFETRHTSLIAAIDSGHAGMISKTYAIRRGMHLSLIAANSLPFTRLAPRHSDSPSASNLGFTDILS